MNKRAKISITGSMMDLVVTMSEGNPGALAALAAIIKADPTGGLIPILSLDDMGMRGSQIYVAWNDYCERDLDKFREAIKERDPKMVAVVNVECPEHRAVTSGASFV